MSFDFSGNPISGQLLSPTRQSLDLSTGGVCADEASEVNGTTGHDSRDMRGLPVDAGNCPSFRDMVTGRIATAPHDNIISALDVELQVSSRKCRPGVMCQGVHAESSGVVQKSRSRFDVLETVVEGNSDNLIQNVGAEPRGKGVRSSEAVGRGIGAAATSPGVLPVDAFVEKESIVEVLPRLPITGSAPSPHVAAKGHVVNVPSQLQSDKHVAVQILENGSYSDLLEHNGRPLYAPIQSTYATGVKCHSVTSKTLLQKDSHSKKKDNMSRSQTVVVEWVVHLSKSLVTECAHGSSSERQIVDSSVPPMHNEIQWIENSTYEGDLQANVQ
ncbi:hypothetical protein V6N13_064875 [Hibiscus sabdariffa]